MEEDECFKDEEYFREQLAQETEKAEREGNTGFLMTSLYYKDLDIFLQCTKNDCGIVIDRANKIEEGIESEGEWDDELSNTEFVRKYAPIEKFKGLEEKMRSDGFVFIHREKFDYDSPKVRSFIRDFRRYLLDRQSDIILHAKGIKESERFELRTYGYKNDFRQVEDLAVEEFYSLFE